MLSAILRSDVSLGSTRATYSVVRPMGDGCGCRCWSDLTKGPRGAGTGRIVQPGDGQRKAPVAGSRGYLPIHAALLTIVVLVHERGDQPSDETLVIFGHLLNEFELPEQHR